MAIKVKHEGSAASRLAASAQGGAAKRAMEAAALAKPSQVQTLQPAHASAPGVGAPHAQLISAPGGGAHAGLVGGGGGLGARFGGGRSRAGTAGTAGTRGSSGGSGDGGDYKVTGVSPFTRPDNESVWEPSRGQWIRNWLPGEKEAEAQRRVGDVKNEQAQQMYDFQLTTQQKRELESINNALEQARRSGRYSPDEMAELERQADARRLGIKPMPVPREDAQAAFDKRLVEANGVKGYLNSRGDFEPFEGAPQSAADVFGGTHVDPATGKRFGVDKSGKLYEVGAERDDFAALMKLVPDTVEKPMIDPATGKPQMKDGQVLTTPMPLSMEERLEYLRQIKQMRDEFNAPKQPAQPAVDPVLAARQQAEAPSVAPQTGQQTQAAEDEDEFAAFRRK